MSNRAWMPLHIADYLADTGHLTATEHGAYMLLIMHYWQNGHLPANEKLIARVARMTADQWEESRDVIAMLFGPGWTHKRIDAELSKADDIIEKRRSAAESRYSKGKSKHDANALHVHSKSSDTGVPPSTDNIATASDEAAASCAGHDLDPAAIESKLRDAAGDKMQPHGGFVVGPVMELIRIGADIDLDVLPTIRAVAARLNRPARSWEYFVPAIQDAMDKRKAAGTWEHRAQPPPGPGQKPKSEAMQRHERIRQKIKSEIYGDENADTSGPIIDLPERDYRPH
ncbi:YdaU family protein [Pararhizobium antarcticum]|uniref:YdaU family protein n=1 Tax=Pararhizobium antarcticum TaxID=1798805 RepID=UPI000B16D8B5|nr:DUF1376 domain-containing protein [Pararhizobium antarcticum]